MSTKAEVQAARQRIVETARTMLAGTLSFIEGARRINSLSCYADLPRFDPDMIKFVAIDCETDTLPFGSVRQLWQPEALAKLQPEIDHAEQWARETGLAACQSVIERFSEGAQSPAPDGQS